MPLACNTRMGGNISKHQQINKHQPALPANIYAIQTYRAVKMQWFTHKQPQHANELAKRKHTKMILHSCTTWCCIYSVFLGWSGVETILLHYTLHLERFAIHQHQLPMILQHHC